MQSISLIKLLWFNFLIIKLKILALWLFNLNKDDVMNKNNFKILMNKFA